MAFTQLELNGFRNFTHVTTTLSPRLTLVVGNNGQGKTNLLEAVYLLLQGRDFRTAVEREAIQQNAIVAQLSGSGELGDHEQNWHHTIPVEGRRSHRGPTVPLVLFSPDDIYLAKGSPNRRRRFLDLLLTAHDPRYARSLRAYNRVLLQRNRALKESPYHSLVDDFTPLLVREGLYLWKRREEAIDAIDPETRALHDRLAAGENLSIRLKYGGVEHPIHTESEFSETIRQRRSDEMARQTTLVGPHRDDLVMTLGDLDTRVFASQGQLRTTALSIKLGTFTWLWKETGVRPLILLDDVLSELDARRRQSVLQVVSEPGQQTIVTDTEPRSYAALDPLILFVSGGEVSPWKN